MDINFKYHKRILKYTHSGDCQEGSIGNYFLFIKPVTFGIGQVHFINIFISLAFSLKSSQKEQFKLYG